MMLRRAAVKLLGALTFTSLVGGLASEANAAEVIKIGTLAPAASPWGQVFKVWAEGVKKTGADPDAAMAELRTALAKYNALTQ